MQTENGINKFDLKNSKNKRRIIRKSLDFSVKSMLKNEDFSYPPPVFNEFLKTYKKINNNAKIIKENIKYKRDKNNIPVITRAIYEDKIYNKKIPIKIDLTEFELNECSYKKALLYDKRTFCQYFFLL